MVVQSQGSVLGSWLPPVANPELTFPSVSSSQAQLQSRLLLSLNLENEAEEAQHFISPEIKSKLICLRFNLLREVTRRHRCVNEVRERAGTSNSSFAVSSQVRNSSRFPWKSLN